jgi:hypothetical protein
LALWVSLVLVSGDVRAGNPIGSEFLIYDDTNVSESLPSIAYNGQSNEYLVVWDVESSGTHEVWGRRVSGTGALLGSAFRISPAGQGAKPDVAYSSAANEYLVVWEANPHVYGQRITASGAHQGGAFIIGYGTSGTSVSDQPAVAYGSTADRYLIAWRYGIDSTGDTGIWARSIQSDGSADGGTLLIRDLSNTLLPEQPDLAYNRSRNEFLVVWQQTSGLGDRDIHGRRVAMTAPPSMPATSFGIITSTGDETVAAVTAVPIPRSAGQYLVTWQTGQDIQARTVSGLETLGSIRDLANTGWGEYRPAAAGCESNLQFLVVWTWVPVSTPPAMMQVQGRTLAVDGAPLQDTTFIGGSQVFDAAVAAGPACSYLVAFDDNATLGSWSRGIYGRLWGNAVYLPLVLKQ